MAILPSVLFTLQSKVDGTLGSLTLTVNQYFTALNVDHVYTDDLEVGSLSVAVPEPSTLLVACVGGVCAIAYGVEKHCRAARTNTRAA